MPQLKWMSAGLAGWVLVAGAGASGACASTSGRQALQFDGAQLGMALNDWKALPIPGAEAAARPACTPAASALVCSYAAPDQEVTLPLVKSYQVRRPKYYFVSGALSKIEFHTSIDAFNDVVTLLESRYGPATQTLRDDLEVGYNLRWPRVRKIWRLTGGTIELTDPTTPASQLAVQFTAPDVKTP